IMFCEKCGAQTREGLRFCESCGAPVRGQSAQPPAFTPKPAYAPVSVRTLPKPNRKPLTIAACIAALLLLVLIFSGGSPEKAAKKFMAAGAGGDFKTAYKYAAPDYDDTIKALVKKNGISEKEYYAALSSISGTKIKNTNQFYNYMKKDMQKYLKDRYGSNYKVTAKVVSSEKLSKEERDSYLSKWENKIKRDYSGVSPDKILKVDKIKQIYKVKVECNIKGKNGSDSYTETLYVAKVGGKWKVITLETGMGL
ncbi:MAG: zinc ribbon domain-containing protein, partial [Clostridiales bacterium]|nr:zinc ribbon domain-containing protein [Clostridiales bacterium]